VITRGGVAVGDDSGADFYVQPSALTVYADLVRGQSAHVGDAVDILDALVVDASWFGKMPQSGHLADGYDRHRDAELGALRELPGALTATAAALDGNVSVYRAADDIAAEEIDAIAVGSIAGA
jgi:hypothetical protein